ncbi:asparagine synthase (glutamine-hydrolyzing) [Streptomyces lydicus]
MAFPGQRPANFPGGRQMCGVAGWVSFRQDLSREENILAGMTNSMTCRGPDASGQWLSRHAALGHRRLSIIDLPGGTQPMTVDTPQGPVTMSYSGETYNFVELRDELRKRGHTFRTRSDTEVVLRGYLEWGAAIAERMVGMCAIAVWDSRYERLTLIRDRMGTKPMHYYRTKDGLLFGSEPKAILAHPDAKPVVDAEGMRQLFSFFTSSENAVWAGMKVMTPGTVIEFDRNGLREHTYWQLTAEEHTDDLDTTVARVRQMVEDNVRHELVADVPLGLLLSGGLDSSALAGIASRHLTAKGDRARTFSVDFPGQSENFQPHEMADSADAPYAKEMAAHIGSEHHDIVLDHRRLSDPELRRSVVAAWDLPWGMGDINGSMYLLFKAVREHVTVALSGEAADEIFAGHVWHQSKAARYGSTFPWHTTWLKRVDCSAYLTGDFRTTLDSEAYTADRFQEATARVPYLDGEDEEQRMYRRSLHLGLNHFMRVLEDRVDRMAMAVGLETRVPFCDYRLAQYLYNVPWTMQTFDGREKSLLRASVKDVVTRSVVERRKSPYPSTQDTLYVGALQEQVKILLKEPSSPVFDLFDRAKLAEAAELSPQQIAGAPRAAFEKVLDLAVWFEIRNPELRY